MARIKLVYLGGGSTRGAGTMASFMANGSDFDGSEVVLVDLDPDRLELIRTLAEKMARARGLDIAVTATTDRRAALDGCDAVLSSFRPGGFAARVHDERIPLEHGVIGQETQGAGGFFMALRAITVLEGRLRRDGGALPDAWIFNYTNPVNIVAEAITHNSPVKIVSLCEGPIYFRDTIAESAGLDPALLDVTMVGLNHGCWGVEQSYDGQDPMPLLAEAWERRKRRPDPRARSTGASSSSRSRWGRSRPTTSSTTTSPTRCSPSTGPSRRRAPRTSSAGRPTTGATTRSRRRPTTRSSIPAAHAAASTSSSSRST